MSKHIEVIDDIEQLVYTVIVHDDGICIVRWVSDMDNYKWKMGLDLPYIMKKRIEAFWQNEIKRRKL